MTKSNLFRTTCLAIAIAISAFAFWNCSKNPTSTPGGDPGETETTTLFGLIKDEAGLPLEGVAVTAGSAADTTGADGLFLLPAAKVPKGRAVILARKTGFYDGSRAEPVGGSGTTRLQLSMMKKTFAYTVSGTAGGTVRVGSDASVEFPATGFTTASGDAYTGSVKVAARYLHPDSSTFYAFFSGDNAGQGADGATVGIASLGVMRVDIQGQGGEVLKLKAGMPATLKYAKPASATDAPASIPLWYFDAELGKWREEGQATLANGIYTGTVTHFTDWNIDYKYGTTWNFYVRVLCDTLPVQGVMVRAYQKTAYSDRVGLVHYINAPADIAVNKLEIRAADNSGRFYRTTPIDLTVRNGDTIDVKLDSKCPTYVFGTLTGCTGDNIPGLAALSIGSEVAYDYSLDGRFFFLAPEATALVLNASDQQNNKLTPPLPILPLNPNELRDLGKVKICGTRESTWVDIRPAGLDDLFEWGVSPNATLIAYTTGAGTLILLDAKTGSQIEKIDVGTENHGNGNIAFSEDDSRMLTISYPNDAHIWDITSKPAKRITTIKGYTSYEMGKDGKTIFASTGGIPSKFDLLSTADGSVIKSLHPTLVKPGVFTNEYNIKWVQALDAIVYDRPDTAGIFMVWSIATDSLARKIDTGPIGQDPYHYNFRFSQDGGVFYVTHDYYNAEIYSTATGKRLDSLLLGQKTEEGFGISALLTPSYIFQDWEISGVALIRQYRIGSHDIIANLATPNFTNGPNPRVAFPAISLDEKKLTVEVAFPGAKPTEGWRIYTLD